MNLLPKYTLDTKTKIGLATILAHAIRSARRIGGAVEDVVTVKRSGLWWRLDLGEGIDFSIYLLGAFEASTVRTIRRIVQPGMVVLDIGANIGAHTLGLARLVGESGKVYAFEPTTYALGKLAQNLALNPDIAPRVVTEQVMLTDRADRPPDAEIYSSWPLFAAAEALHPKHLGRPESTLGSRAMRLDDYVEAAGVERIDFVKIDVDGFECHVLSGGMAALKTFRPIILTELAPYSLAERGRSLEELLDILQTIGYRLRGLGSSTWLPMDAQRLRAIVPDGASRNVIAQPT